ncbi:MAG TPA: hypothetical protein ACQGQX_00970, partial [Xylella taiwanensis]
VDHREVLLEFKRGMPLILTLAQMPRVSGRHTTLFRTNAALQDAFQTSKDNHIRSIYTPPTSTIRHSTQ